MDLCTNAWSTNTQIIFYKCLAVLQNHSFTDVLMDVPGLRLTTWIFLEILILVISLETQGSTLAVFRYPENPRFPDGIPDSPEQ